MKNAAMFAQWRSLCAVVQGIVIKSTMIPNKAASPQLR